MKFPEKWDRAAAPETQPHLWTLHNDFGSSGAVYFLLQPGDDLDLENQILASAFENAFMSIDGVYGVRLDATFVEVEWATRDDPSVIGTAYRAIISTGVGCLSQHFNWQGELNIQKFDTLRDMQIFRQQMDLRGRWRFGSY